MEFWGVEVKAGESLKVKPELFKLIHVSQAAIGEVKDVKEAKHVPLRLTVGENSYVIGTLSAEERPQLMFDLVFEKEFELSHGWKNGSVYFIGYTADDPSTDEIDSGDDDFSDEEENILEALNGKLEADVKEAKPDAKKSALVEDEKKAKVAEPKKDAESDSEDDDSEDDDDEDDSEDDSDDVPLGMDGLEGMDDSEEDDSEEETPKKVVEQKKRPAPSPKVAPGSGKKAKQATPDNKSGGKKGPATPFAKQNGGKPAFNGNNNNKQSPKSGGQFSGNKSNNKNLSGQKNFKGKQGRK